MTINEEKLPLLRDVVVDKPDKKKKFKKLLPGDRLSSRKRNKLVKQVS